MSYLEAKNLPEEIQKPTVNTVFSILWNKSYNCM